MCEGAHANATHQNERSGIVEKKSCAHAGAQAISYDQWRFSQWEFCLCEKLNLPEFLPETEIQEPENF